MTPLLQVDDLVKDFTARRGLFSPVDTIRAVDHVSFTLEVGRTLALVGESGAGKSTVGRLVLRLLRPTAGSVRFQGQDLLAVHSRELRQLRRSLQIIMQDPYSSLDPRMDILSAVAEPFVIFTDLSRRDREAEAQALLDRVGIPSELGRRLPEELSGGQLQRASIARALATKPRLIVCDEPVAALDVSVQAQVINLLYELQAELGHTYLFISHDLALVRAIADEVAVMKDGAIVEQGLAEEVFTSPRAPYTRELLEAIPRIPARKPA